jgi:tetratricopeptide (TPR) repeat protein
MREGHSTEPGHLREALELFRRLGGRRGEAWVLVAMGRAAWGIDVDARPAVAWFEDALQIFREIDEPAGIAWLLTFLGEEQFKVGDLEGAASRAAEAFDVGTRLGLLQVVADSRRMLAMVATTRGQYADAERLLAEAAAAHEQAGDRWQLALILTGMARVALESGDNARALEPLRKALRKGARRVFALRPYQTSAVASFGKLSQKRAVVPTICRSQVGMSTKRGVG